MADYDYDYELRSTADRQTARPRSYFIERNVPTIMLKWPSTKQTKK